jgi:hypothetical protein
VTRGGDRAAEITRKATIARAEHEITWQRILPVDARKDDGGKHSTHVRHLQGKFTIHHIRHTVCLFRAICDVSAPDPVNVGVFVEDGAKLNPGAHFASQGRCDEAQGIYILFLENFPKRPSRVSLQEESRKRRVVPAYSVRWVTGVCARSIAIAVVHGPC